MPRNPIEAALAEIDSQIADLQRAKDMIIRVSSKPDAPAKPRKPRVSRKGLPKDEDPKL